MFYAEMRKSYLTTYQLVKMPISYLLFLLFYAAQRGNKNKEKLTDQHRQGISHIRYLKQVLLEISICKLAIFIFIFLAIKIHLDPILCAFLFFQQSAREEEDLEIEVPLNNLAIS